MKKYFYLLTLIILVMSVMSCKTYTIYDKNVIGVVDEVYVFRHKPYKYEVYLTTYEGGRKHYIFKTNQRYEIGDYINVPIMK